MKPIFADAQQQHREHPTTFSVPNARELRSIRRGTHIKLSLLDIERMWFVVLARSGDRMIVALQNDPFVVQEARFNDLFVCETRHVFDIGPMMIPSMTIKDFEKEHAGLAERWSSLVLTDEHQARMHEFVNGKLEPGPISGTGSLPN